MNRSEIITCKKCGMPLKKGTKLCSYCRQDTGYLINRAPKEHKYIRIWNWRIPIPWVTLILILLNAVAGIYKLAGGEYDVIRHLGMTQGALQRGEVLRFVLSNFLHMGLPHFISNMYGLAIYGFIFENRIGKWKYLLIYIASMLGSSLLINFLGGNGIHAGASGAIFGLSPRASAGRDTSAELLPGRWLLCCCSRRNVKQGRHNGTVRGTVNSIASFWISI